MLSLAAKEAIRKTLLFTSKPIGHFFAGLGACFTYHTIVSGDPQRSLFNPNLPLKVHVRRFEEHISFLARKYRCMDLDTAATLLSEGRLPSRTVLITFDDGYKDNLELALPVLRKYNVPAAVFITTGFVDRISGPWWYELESILGALGQIEFNLGDSRFKYNLKTAEQKQSAFRKINYLMMGLPPASQSQLLETLRQAAELTKSVGDLILDWEGVRQLAKDPLITIGCHTRNHLVLRKVSKDLLQEEIIESRQRLEGVLKRPVRHFCYPFGSKRQVGWREFQTVRDLGFISAFTTSWGNLHRHHSRSMTALPRFDIGYHDTIAALEWKLNGLEAIRHKLGRHLLRSRAAMQRSWA